MIIVDDKSDVGYHAAEANDSEFSDYQSLEDEYLHHKNGSDDDSSSSIKHCRKSISNIKMFLRCFISLKNLI